MDFINPHFDNVIEAATIGTNDSKYTNSADGIQILDYCMYKNLEQVKSISLDHQEVCFNRMNSVSDHNGLVTVFDMDEEELAYEE